MAQNKVRKMLSDEAFKFLSKWSGEGSPSVPLQRFKSSGWILCSWANRSPNCQNSFSSLWGQQLSRNIRQKIRAQPSEIPSPHNSELSRFPLKYTNMDRMRYIGNPLLFTAFVGTSSIIGCTIWQYEEYRNSFVAGRFSLSNFRNTVLGGGSDSGINTEIPPIKRFSKEILQKAEAWWSGLSPAEKIFWPICAINCAVWLAWRIPVLAPFMVTYFSATPVGRRFTGCGLNMCCTANVKGRICVPMLLSTFSHYSFLHLCANMFVLHSFLPAAVQILGKEQFVAMYLTSGTVASLGSHLHKLYICNATPSLGASGAIMGILGLVCTRMPDIQLGIIFVPGVQFTADTALKCILAVDTAGVLLGWRIMDHAAHLTGCLFGVGFSHYGGQTFWAFRDYVMTQWHKFRTQGASNS